jgi:MFS family permease
VQANEVVLWVCLVGVSEHSFLLQPSSDHENEVRMFGQAIGPVFGGALTQYLGFRSIFYFLLGLAGFVVVILFLYLPETLPKIAGDGSKPLYGIYRPLLGNAKRDGKISKDERYKPTSLSFGAILDSFKLVLEKDVAISLVFGGIIYTVWSMITSSTSTLFKKEYHLSEVVVGLCFLPNGIISYEACTSS